MSIYSIDNAVSILRRNNYKVEDAWDIVSGFESLISNFCGSKFAVALDNCTNALFLSLKYKKIKNKEIIIPSNTYLSVPQTILRSGNKPIFKDLNWTGFYEMGDTGIFDSAGRLAKKMYVKDSFMCCSFHLKKNIPIGKGGMILTDSKNAYDWFYKAVYEGRDRRQYHDSINNLEILGWNMYMTPEQAAFGIDLFENYQNRKDFVDVASSKKYKDLSEFLIFKENNLTEFF